MIFPAFARAFLFAALLGSMPACALGAGLNVAGITVDTAKGELRFAAQVNQRTGPVEYLLVHRMGKVHESVLATEVRPADLHAAALLLGFATTNRASPSKARPVRIELRFADRSNRLDAAGVVRLQGDDGTPLLPWSYGGSVEFDGNFLAQQEGSIVTLIEDDTALVQSGHAERTKDDVWFANEKTLPRVGTPVEVILREEKPAN